MINLGDITKIHGGTAPVVDAVIGGSPCHTKMIERRNSEDSKSIPNKNLHVAH